MPPVRVQDARSTPAPGGSGFAAQACSTCRRQRRKCTKTLPACLLCRRLGKPCDYSDNQPTRSDQDEISFLRSRVAALEAQLARREDSADTPSGAHPDSLAPDNFAAAFFLDSVMFEHSNHEATTPKLDLPPELPGISNAQSEARATAAAFFHGFHSCFPIISKRRMLQRLSDPSAPFTADLELLLECMQLFNQDDDASIAADRQLYRSCKALYAHAEAQRILSVHLLQSCLLLAAYEVAHAIYPAAYLSVGSCARLGICMGLHDGKSALQLLPPPVTSTELEERRRAWWAVIALEMFVNLGSRHHPLACPAPRADDILPQDDEKWDHGVANSPCSVTAPDWQLIMFQEMGVSQPLALSANASIHASPFARLCQVSHILSCVIRHVDDKSIGLKFRYEEAVQLRKTIQSLSAAIANELGSTPGFELVLPYTEPSLLAALAISYSTEMTLHERYACTGLAGPVADGLGSPELLELQSIAIARLHELSDAVLRLSKIIQYVPELYGISSVSPFVMDALYQAGANFAWMVAETGGDKHTEKLAAIKTVLGLLGKRWNSANEYLRMMEASLSQHRF